MKTLTILRLGAVLLCVFACHACSTTDSTTSSALSSSTDAEPDARPLPDNDVAAQPDAGMGEDGKLVPATLGIPPATDTDVTYRIGPSDLLRIEVFRVEDLSSEERVNEEGFIVMPLVGAVKIGGLTPREAEQLLSGVLRKYVRDPQVNVFVTEYASQNVTVAGAVEESGLFPLKGRTTLLQAIAQAGGIDELGNEEEVVIFRLDANENTHAYVVNLEEIQDGTLRDPVLIGNDRIFVPKSGTAVIYKNVLDALRGGFVRLAPF